MRNKFINYLGVRINFNVNADNFKPNFKHLLEKGGSKIYTINPEFIVDSFFDTNFKLELNSSDLNVIDGVGLLFAIKKYFKSEIGSKDLKDLKTLTGVDLVFQILEEADKNKLSVFLLGGSKELDSASKAIQNIKSKYPNIKLIGASSDFKFSPEDDLISVNFINESLKEASLKELDVLLVGYGHKKQEFWIQRNSSKIPARVSVGVGGTIDYLAGTVNRAPLWVRNLGFEWLFRLFTQPSRALRIFKATFIFSYLSSSLLSKNLSKK